MDYKYRGINKTNVGLSVGVNVGVNLTKTEQNVLDAIKKNNAITAVLIASQCNVTTRTIERAIKSLKEKNLIKRVDSDKTVIVLSKSKFSLLH
ncbi:MAG: HTH domain-containing protein [Anaeroplasmataceae bacterium]|nr:HTH domain-containing protein [Anaeroplasmataceae bacterium]